MHRPWYGSSSACSMPSMNHSAMLSPGCCLATIQIARLPSPGSPEDDEVQDEAMTTSQSVSQQLLTLLGERLIEMRREPREAGVQPGIATGVTDLEHVDVVAIERLAEHVEAHAFVRLQLRDQRHVVVQGVGRKIRVVDRVLHSIRNQTSYTGLPQQHAGPDRHWVAEMSG